MATRLWKPVEREFEIDGARYVVTLAPGRGSATGDVLLGVRRVGAHRAMLVRNLSLTIREQLRKAPELPLATPHPAPQPGRT